MERKPRPSDEPVLPRLLLVWLAVVGLVMGVGDARRDLVGRRLRGLVVARTMGLTVFSLANLFYSFTTRDELRSVFNLDVLEDRRFLYVSGMSLAAIVLGTELGVLQRILHTVSLTLNEWLVCVAVAALVVAASEIRKLVLRRREGDAPTDRRTPQSATTSATA